MFSEGLDVALTAYEHRSKIREIGQWLWNRVVKGEVRIMVFGSAGTSAGYDEKIRLRHEHELLRMLQAEVRNG